MKIGDSVVRRSTGAIGTIVGGAGAWWTVEFEGQRGQSAIETLWDQELAELKDHAPEPDLPL